MKNSEGLLLFYAQLEISEIVYTRKKENVINNKTRKGVRALTRMATGGLQPRV